MESFQKKMLEVLHNLMGVFFPADDILVVEYSETVDESQ